MGRLGLALLAVLLATAAPAAAAPGLDGPVVAGPVVFDLVPVTGLWLDLEGFDGGHDLIRFAEDGVARVPDPCADLPFLVCNDPCRNEVGDGCCDWSRVDMGYAREILEDCT